MNWENLGIEIDTLRRLGQEPVFWGDNGGRRSGEERRRILVGLRSGMDRRLVTDRRRSPISKLYPKYERRRIFFLEDSVRR
ncbi:MAG: hypothetical protein QNI92_01000 [Desulfobacterales bacterium]|nr:hypothetical protein [Desulfobacterales bacterium]MDJ0914831.1 hypothetical protein [Desulfobacterales bacterium]